MNLLHRPRFFLLLLSSWPYLSATLAFQANNNNNNLISKHHGSFSSSPSWRRKANTFDGFSSEELEKATTVFFQYDDDDEEHDNLPIPNPSLEPMDVLSACMSTLLDKQDAGLEVCFNFSSDRCRAALGGSLERFAEYAQNPVFGYLVKCCDYEVVNVGPLIQGTPTRGDMQTILMEAKQGEDKLVDSVARRFLWTFQKERRPPKQGCWVIHEVIYVKNAFDLTL